MFALVGFHGCVKVNKNLKLSSKKLISSAKKPQMQSIFHNLKPDLSFMASYAI
jgi:hypothetical protein